MFESLTLAASSTPIVTRFLCSTPSEPTMASAYDSNPHIFRHLSTLFTKGEHQKQDGCECSERHTRLLSQPPKRMGVVEVSPRTIGPREPSPPECAYPFAGRTPSDSESLLGAGARSANSHHARHQLRRAERVHSVTPSVKTCTRSAQTLPTPRIPTFPAPVSPINAVSFPGTT